jgi:teichuronic acid biosynthesis glycosyltransferase TuaC
MVENKNSQFILSSKPIRVLWTHNFDPQVTNSGNFMYRLAADLKHLGFYIEFLYLGKLSRPLSLLRARRQVKQMSSNFDLVHVQFGSACAFASAASRVPALLTVRGSDWHRYRGPHRAEARHGWLSYLFTRLSLSSYKAVVTMSERMTKEVKVAFPHQTVVTIPDPIDTSLFYPKSRTLARKTLFGSASKNPWVLFTTLSENNAVKRLSLAQEAVKLASLKIPGLELKVATGIEYNQMPYFVSACNVALCTSTHEGWPNSIKEALACGLPFVSTDVSDLHLIAGRHPSCRISNPSPEELADQLCLSFAAGPDAELRNEILSMDLRHISFRLRDLYNTILDRNY